MVMSGVDVGGPRTMLFSRTQGRPIAAEFCFFQANRPSSVDDQTSSKFVVC